MAKDLFVKNLRNLGALNETVRERKSWRASDRKENRGGGYGEDGLLHPLNRTEKGVDRRPAGGGGRGADDPGHGDGREVGQNGEEVEGNSFRSSPWSGTDCGGRSTAAGGLQPRRHGRWWLEAWEGERKAGAAWG
jgi:hypothetical protein